MTQYNITGVGHTLNMVCPPYDDAYECEQLSHYCAEALRDNKIPQVSINIKNLSAKHISIIRDTMKKYDCVVETSSMYETEILTFERKK